MAQTMKEFANNFKIQFKQDQAVLSKMEKVQETNLSATKKQNQNLDALNKSALTSFWWKLVILLVGVIVFVFSLFFIWLTPSKIRHSNLIG